MSQGLTSFRAALLVSVLTAASVTHAEAPLPDERLGYRTAPLLLLSRPDVRADVGLNPMQGVEAEKEIADLFVRANALRGQRDRYAEKARREIDESMEKWLQGHLNEEQFRRLVEVDLQWEGPSALISRPLIGDRLALTPAQRNSLKHAIDDRNKTRAERGFRIDQEEQLARKALAILNAEQRKTWKSMLGPPFHPQLASAPADPLRR